MNRAAKNRWFLLRAFSLIYSWSLSRLSAFLIVTPEKRDLTEKVAEKNRIVFLRDFAKRFWQRKTKVGEWQKVDAKIFGVAKESKGIKYEVGRGKFLEVGVARRLFASLPEEINDTLREGFLSGQSAKETVGWDKVAGYFKQNSRIIPELIDNPGTSSMLERIYTGRGIYGAIDEYFRSCLAGQALRNRLEATIKYSGKYLSQEMHRNGSLLALNLGGGSARDTVTLSQRIPELSRKLVVDCIDIDPAANQKGAELAKELSVSNHKFLQEDMLKLRSQYRGEANYGVLVGILCELEDSLCVQILSIIRRYFKPGSQVVAAWLLEEMKQQDPLCTYLLTELVPGWSLLYRQRGHLKDIFLKSGYKWGGSFSDEPTNFYEIGIGIV